jgi:hypothetical protein
MNRQPDEGANLAQFRGMGFSIGRQSDLPPASTPLVTTTHRPEIDHQTIQDVDHPSYSRTAAEIGTPQSITPLHGWNRACRASDACHRHDPFPPGRRGRARTDQKNAMTAIRCRHTPSDVPATPAPNDYFLHDPNPSAIFKEGGRTGLVAATLPPSTVITAFVPVRALARCRRAAATSARLARRASAVNDRSKVIADAGFEVAVCHFAQSRNGGRAAVYCIRAASTKDASAWRVGRAWNVAL